MGRLLINPSSVNRLKDCVSHSFHAWINQLTIDIDTNVYDNFSPNTPLYAGTGTEHAHVSNNQSSNSTDQVVQVERSLQSSYTYVKSYEHVLSTHDYNVSTSNPLLKHAICHHSYVSHNRSLNPNKFGFINVNKLKNKLNISEFVHNYDLLMCAEIKVGYLDLISVNGYTFHCSKLVKTSHKAGGVGIFIRNDFIDDFEVIICTDHCKKCSDWCNIPNVLWLVLGDVLFIVVYVHPERSIYADSEIFDTIVSTSMELLEHFNEHNICLTGDFNASTVSIDDCVYG